MTDLSLIMKPPRYDDVTFNEPDGRADVCPYCGGRLTKEYKYFDGTINPDTLEFRGWVRVKNCLRCAVKLEQLQQPTDWRR